MDIVSYDSVTGDIFCIFEILIRKFHRKQRVKVVDKPFLVAMQGYQGIRVLRYEQTIVPRVTFDKTLSMCIQYIEIFDKITFGILRAHKAYRRVKDILPVLSTFHVGVVHIFSAQLKR